MKAGAFILGVLILVPSVMVFMAGQQQVEDAEDLGGQVTRALSDDAQQQYEQAHYMRLGGIAGGVLGLLLVLAGLVAGGGGTKVEKTVETRTERDVVFTCETCGAQFDTKSALIDHKDLHASQQPSQQKQGDRRDVRPQPSQSEQQAKNTRNREQNRSQCPQCGHELTNPKARFCPECGTEVR